MRSLVVALALAFATGCADSDRADGDADPAAAPSTASSSAAPRYIDPADTEALNEAARKAYDAAVRAVDEQAMARCNALADWVPCYRRLLGTYADGLEAQADQLDALAAGDYEEACVTALQRGAREVRTEARRVSGIVEAWVSGDQAQQAAATKRYARTVRATLTSAQQVLVDVTPLCFSPEVLESVSPSATDSAPSGG